VRAEQHLSRRQFAQSSGVALALLFWQRLAHATIVSGMTLEALVQRSAHIVLVTPFASSARFIDLPGSHRIVTDVNVRIDQVLAKAPPAASEVSVRVLGGVIGKSAEFVDGQAELSRGAPCLLFLCRVTDDVHWVAGMAQGHFPLRIDDAGTARLSASPRLPEMLHPERSAARRLVGADIPAARALVERALAP
jgi:hypothetical protein